MAVSVAILRMQADRHYLTDVMAGAALGTITGFALPILGHYWFVELPHVPGVASRWTLAPVIDAERWGATVLGVL